MLELVEFLNALGRWLTGHLGRLSLELAIFAAVVAAVITVLRIRSPKVRHLFWALVLIKPLAAILIASPVSLYWFMRPLARPADVPAAGVAGPNYARPGLFGAARRPYPRGTVAAPGPASAELPGSRSAWRRLDRYGIGALAWLAVASGLGIRLLVGWAYVMFLRRTAHVQRHGPLARAVTRAAKALKLRRDVTVAVSDVVPGPVLAGIVRPLILMPRRLADELSPDRLELIAAHELAHVRRWDNAVLLAQRLAETVLFFHPAVWLCGWAIRREAEAACDDAVLAACGASDVYADSLTRVAEARAGLGSRVLVNTFAAAETNLGRRVRRVLRGRPARMAAWLTIASVVSLILIGCLGLPSASRKPQKPDEKKGTAMTESDKGAGAFAYGFRRHPMKWVNTSRPLDAAKVRTFVFNTPAPGDAKLIEASIAKVLASQRPDGSFADTAKESGSRLLELLELGIAHDRPEVGRAVEAILRQKRAGRTADEWFQHEGCMSVYPLHALCLLGRADVEEVGFSLRWLADHPGEYVGFDKGCPWTPAVFLKALWAGRKIADVEAAVVKGLRWFEANLNAAGCMRWKEPWGILDCAGYIDHPVAARIVARQVPMILRGQRRDGGWGRRSVSVFRALKTHGLLDTLAKRPPLPPDWKVVRSIPAPPGRPFTLTWDGKRLWTYDRKANQAVAVSPADGSVMKRLDLPAGKVFGIGRWDGALAVSQKNPNRGLKVDPASGEVQDQIALTGVESVLCATKVGDEMWVADGWLFPGGVADPSADKADLSPDGGGPRLESRLAGPCPNDFAVAADGVWQIDFWAPAILKSASAGRLADWGEKPFGGAVNGIAWDGQRLWALNAKTGRICVIEKTESGKKLAAPDVPAATAVSPASRLKREGDRVWIDGITAWDMGRKPSSIHAAQAAVMQAVGEDVTYEQLVGASGLAFRMQVHKELCPSSPHPFCGTQCVKGSNRMLPWKLKVYEVKPDDAAGVAEARKAVVASIDRGVPVQYGSEEDGLIVGYQAGGEQWLCVHPLKGGGKRFVERKWPWGIAVFTGPKAKTPSTRELAMGALKQAVRMAHTPDDGKGDYMLGLNAWDHWLGKVRGLLGADEKALSAAMMGNSWIYTSLVEHRSVAARYLRSVAGEFKGEPAKRLRAAAGLYEKMAMQVLTEEGDCALDVAPTPWYLKDGAKWTDAMRRDQIKRLTA
ncbi:MAG: M56 family metallopeptidase, partial [Planctomycetota bacterium]